MTLAPYSKISFGVWAVPPPAPPPGRWAWLASATTAEQRGQRDPAQHEPASAAHGGTLDKHGNRAALGLEDRVLDVAEILAVGLQRQRPVAGDLDPVEVVAVEQLARARARGRSATWRKQPRQRHGAHPPRARPGRGRARSAPRARRGSGSRPRRCRDRCSRRARRRPGRAPGPRAPARSAAAARRDQPQRRRATKAVSPGRLPSSRRPSASTRRTSSASRPIPAEKPKRRPFTRPTEIGRVRPDSSASATCRAAVTGSRGEAERAREHVRPAAGEEAERNPVLRRRSAPR